MHLQTKKIILSLLLVSVLATGSVMAGRTGWNRSGRGTEAVSVMTKKSSVRTGARTTKASPKKEKGGLTPAEISAKKEPLTGIEEFVAKHLEEARVLKGIHTFDPTTVPPLSEVLQKTTNYHQLPPQYVALIDANRDQQSWKKSYALLYWGKKLILETNKNRIVVDYYELDPSLMMATFEPVPNAKPFFTVPDKVLKTFSDEERAYTETLRDVVNENISFLFDVPFFVPDMDMFRRNEYGGKFIPEKYLVSGDKVDLIPAHLVDDRKRDIQKRFGFPIYDVTQVETGRIINPTTCFYHSEYDKMKVVDRLVLLNLDMLEHEYESLVKMRYIQYDRVRKTLLSLQEVVAQEADYLKDKGQWTPKIQKVLTQLNKQLEKVIPPAIQQLTEAIKQKKFIYSLNQPDRQPRLIRQRNVMKPAPYTSGRQKED